MKAVIVIALLLFIFLSIHSINAADFIHKEVVSETTPGVPFFELRDNLKVSVTFDCSKAGVMYDLYGVEIRGEIPEEFELISGNTYLHQAVAVFAKDVELSYVVKALEPGLFQLPVNITILSGDPDPYPISINANMPTFLVIDPANVDIDHDPARSQFRKSTKWLGPWFYIFGKGYSLSAHYSCPDTDESYTINFKSHPEVLRIDEKESHVVNLESGTKQTYKEFLNSTQFEGDRLEFNISLSKTSWWPLWSEHDALELSTNLDHSKWKFGDFVSLSEKAVVLKDIKWWLVDEIPYVILSGKVPKQILNEEVYVTLTALRNNHRVEPTMKFSSVSKSIIPTSKTQPSVTPASTPPISTPLPTVTLVPISPTPMSTPSPTATATEIPTPEESVPGFGVIFAIAGLLAVAYLLRKKG